MNTLEGLREGDRLKWEWICPSLGPRSKLDVKIEKYCREHEEEVIHIMCEAFMMTKADAEYHIKGNRRTAFVAVNEIGTVGGIVMWQLPTSFGRRASSRSGVEVTFLCVEVAWRGKGVGRRLFKHVLQEAAAKVRLHASEKRRASRSLPPSADKSPGVNLDVGLVCMRAFAARKFWSTFPKLTFCTMDAWKKHMADMPYVAPEDDGDKKLWLDCTESEINNL